jgi:ectoine hydroxylase-related dioxygenase (phytanoyl-CoA dioxygenase family)
MKKNLNSINLKKKFQADGYLHFKSFFGAKDITTNHSKIIKVCKKIPENRLINPHLKIQEISKLYKNKKLVNFVKILLEKKINGLQSELFINPPGSKGHPPHQDDFFLKTGINNSLNAWIPLVKTNKINGTLRFFKKNKFTKINQTLNNKFLNNKNISLPKNFKKKAINCNIGDVVFISNSIFHCSSNNLSKKNRFVVAFGYIKKGSKFAVGKTAKRKITKLN